MNKHDVDGIEAARLAQAWASARYVVHAGVETLPLTVDGADVSLAIGSTLVPFAVGKTAPAVERRWPAQRYLFISAWNPAAMPVTAPQNQLADTRLQQHLRQRDLAMQAASACDGNGGHHESGWLVLQASVSQADRLARAFGQGGVLVWDAGQAVRLRMMWPKPTSAPDHVYIDGSG